MQRTDGKGVRCSQTVLGMQRKEMAAYTAEITRYF